MKECVSILAADMQRLPGGRRGGQIPARLHEDLPTGTEEGEEAARGWGVDWGTKKRSRCVTTSQQAPTRTVWESA